MKVSLFYSPGDYMCIGGAAAEKSTKATADSSLLERLVAAVQTLGSVVSPTGKVQGSGKANQRSVLTL